MTRGTMRSGAPSPRRVTVVERSARGRRPPAAATYGLVMLENARACSMSGVYAQRPCVMTWRWFVGLAVPNQSSAKTELCRASGGGSGGWWAGSRARPSTRLRGATTRRDPSLRTPPCLRTPSRLGGAQAILISARDDGWRESDTLPRTTRDASRLGWYEAGGPPFRATRSCGPTAVVGARFDVATRARTVRGVTRSTPPRRAVVHSN